jgi:hypothetical protein
MITHRLDDRHIERMWKAADTAEIEKLANALVEKAQEAQGIEEDLSRLLYLAFKCGFKMAI